MRRDLLKPGFANRQLNLASFTIQRFFSLWGGDRQRFFGKLIKAVVTVHS